ncbi:MAG: hypothetical protein EXR69_09490 [Myxococcales bacterium]|nr:hypothetical protein [Myxococcales bacterium]
MTPTMALALGLRLSGESVNDATLAQMYGDRSLSGEFQAAIDLPHGLRASALIGYRRSGGYLIDAEGQLGDATSWIRYLPVAGLIGLHTEVGKVDLGAGLGPAAVSFAEQVGIGGPEISRGWKWGALVEGSARVQLGELQATDSALSVEVSAGYRAMMRRHGEVCNGEDVCGFDLGAVKIGLGVVVAL